MASAPHGWPARPAARLALASWFVVAGAILAFGPAIQAATDAVVPAQGLVALTSLGSVRLALALLGALLVALGVHDGSAVAFRRGSDGRGR